MTRKILDASCQEKRFTIKRFFFLKKYKRKLAIIAFLEYSFPVNDTFALLNNEMVLVLEIDGNDALVSFKCGAEEWVQTTALEIQP